MTAAIDRLPTRPLPLQPKLKSRDDVDAALEALSYLKSREATIDAACDAKVRLWKSQAQADKVVDVDGDQVTFADRRAALLEAIEAFAERNRDAIFAECKTAEFSFGTLSLRKQPTSIVFADGEDEKSVIAAIDAKRPFVSKVKKLFGELKLFRQPLERYIRTKHELNKQSLRSDRAADTLSEEQLAEIGLATAGGEEALSITVADYAPASESTAAVA